MNEQEFEAMLTRILKHDFSEGTEPFRDELLKRSLDVLDSDAQQDGPVVDPSEIDSKDLEFLAAAGIPEAWNWPFLNNN